MSAIVEIHRDRLDMHVSGEKVDMSAVLHSSDAELTVDEQADLNTMFLTARTNSHDLEVRPGNLYLPVPDSGNDCLHALCHVSVDDLIHEIVKVRGYGEYNKVADQFKAAETREKGSAKAKELERKMNGLFEEIKGKCIPFLLELTPSCDFAQRKQRVARFVGGLLVADKIPRLSTGSNKEIGPIRIDYKSGIWHPVCSARFPFSIPFQKVMVAPQLRLRASVLLDIQAWIAAQFARPGYLKAEPPR